MIAISHEKLQTNMPGRRLKWAVIKTDLHFPFYVVSTYIAWYPVKHFWHLFIDREPNVKWKFS